jgi:hypothetical protein
MMNALAKKLQSGADGGDQPAFRGIAASLIGMAGAPGFIISLAQLSQLRAIFGIFGLIFVVKSCVSIAEL